MNGNQESVNQNNAQDVKDMTIKQTNEYVKYFVAGFVAGEGGFVLLMTVPMEKECSLSLQLVKERAMQKYYK